MRLLLMYEPSAHHRAALMAAAPGATLLVAHSEAEAQQLIVEADAVLGNRYFLQALPYARRLRWMQSNSMGMDLILRAGERLRNVVLTNARGVYDDELAEHCLALALALARGLHLARDRQQQRRWERTSLATLAGRRALILGWGGVGRAIARRLRALGMSVAGVRRSHQGAPAPDAEGFLIWGPAAWRAALPSTDLLILALPLTPDTYRLVGAEELAALPAHAWLINIGRGATLDEAALLQALASERLAGAALDVLADEPPPPDHPIWSEARVLLTPHVGRSLERPPYRWEALFVENVRRFAAGEPLLNVVDQQRGY